MSRQQKLMVETEIPCAWAEQLASMAQTAGKTQSQLMYEAIAAYLGQPLTEPEQGLEKLKKGLTARALCKRLGVSKQALVNAQKQGPEYFAQWTKESEEAGKNPDPDNLGWEWLDVGYALRYHPRSDNKPTSEPT
ncbi:MAG: hypothetical protein F6K19_00655 [Cyanothece sp. SIO1E1]|nr:hypothetical protein [Cyanothece sp. SIO1E1]